MQKFQSNKTRSATKPFLVRPYRFLIFWTCYFLLPSATPFAAGLGASSGIGLGQQNVQGCVKKYLPTLEGGPNDNTTAFLTAGPLAPPPPLCPKTGKAHESESAVRWGADKPVLRHGTHTATGNKNGPVFKKHVFDADSCHTDCCIFPALCWLFQGPVSDASWACKKALKSSSPAAGLHGHH